MHHTAWTKKVSSLPSDRIQPKHSQQHNTSNPSKSKGKTKEPPRSKEVRKLESLLDGIRTSTGNNKDPNGGCFCQARGHELSSHNPICRECGLILCTLNLPQYACPHCFSPLITPAARSLLIARLEEQISETLVKEAEERDRLVEEARKAAGAFPTLSGASTPPDSTTASRAQEQTHKVLSLNSKTKKVVVSSYTPSPVPSPPPSRGEEIDDEPDRLPPPPQEVMFAKAKLDPARPWANLKGGGVHYIPPPKVTDDATKANPRRKRRNKGSGQMNEAETSNTI